MLFCNPSGSKESKRIRSWRYYKDNLWPEPRVNRYPSEIWTCKCAGNFRGHASLFYKQSLNHSRLALGVVVYTL